MPEALLDLRPEDIAARYDEDALMVALRALKQLNPARQDTVEAVLDYWLVQRLARPADVEGLLHLDQLCALAVRRAAPDESGRLFASNLRKLRDLIELKRRYLESADSGRASQLHRAPEILQALSGGPLGQSELLAGLEISAGRLSQLLAVMEEGGLITRQRRGKFNFVSLGESARPVPPAVAPTQKAAMPPRLLELMAAG